MEEIHANKVSDLMIRTPVFRGFPESAKAKKSLINQHSLTFLTTNLTMNWIRA